MAGWYSGESYLGEFTKMPTKDGNLLLSWNPSESADLTLVAASDKAYYAADYWYNSNMWTGDEFDLEIVLDPNEGPIAFSGSAPEPTSGLLLLLGVAGLALKRKVKRY